MFIYFIMAMCIGCKARTIIPILDEVGIKNGVYYKDTYNDFDKFVGTWKFQSGNTVFEIKLIKKIMFYSSSSNNYSDMLVGEYRYVNSAGIEIINTLANLNFNLQPYKNNIAGKYIRDENKPVAERRVQLYFTDPERNYLNREIIVKHHASQGNIPETIEIEFTGETSVVPDDNSPTELRVPEQNYILTKVE